MSMCICPTCGTDFYWEWEEAFNKFGFGDGDALVMTDLVAKVLREAGYEVTVERWGVHNTVITSITQAGAEQIPDDFDYCDGDPRERLPKPVVDALDAAFSSKSTTLDGGVP